MRCAASLSLVVLSVLSCSRNQASGQRAATSKPEPALDSAAGPLAELAASAEPAASTSTATPFPVLDG
ncbi:MAG TPA: hypothetical protein VHW01_28345, partial [Polyangiaceae bacterium]|nr:hypothetical protein [Polyangiaceae bacterium]